MTQKRLQPGAWLTLLLLGLFCAAQGLCDIFVGVYFYVNSLDLQVVCLHYLTLYIVTPTFFVLSGWYSQARDRLHVFRAGLVLHVVYYAILLTLQERCADYAIPLGALLGVTWGIYYAGANTFNFDFTVHGKREFYLGLMRSVTGSFRLVAPLIGALIIWLSPEKLVGYHRLFAVALVIYCVCFILSFKLPRDSQHRPFRIARALFPGKDQRDWRLVMWASFTLAGSYSIFAFLLSVVLFMETKDELAVGGFASIQALAAILVSMALARTMVPRNRRKFMRWGVVLLVAAGAVISFKLSVLTLVAFGLLRSLAGPLFGIGHTGLRMDIMAKSAEHPSQRIEYLCAWEVPLAAGRIIMMLTVMGLAGWLTESGLGLRIALFMLCAIRIVTYWILSRTSAMRETA
jgi:MFS transporter, YQGE family, putative transporter